MIEIHGNLWDYYGRPNTVVFITTNGTINRQGRAVMGRGCALEAKQRFPQIDLKLATNLSATGNTLSELLPGLWSFPTKHDWRGRADLGLIQLSSRQLAALAKARSQTVFVLPRPGCGNGGLNWEKVKPALAFLPDNVRIISP
jgi:hypothetical protein